MRQQRGSKPDGTDVDVKLSDPLEALGSLSSHTLGAGRGGKLPHFF